MRSNRSQDGRTLQGRVHRLYSIARSRGRSPVGGRCLWGRTGVRAAVHKGRGQRFGVDAFGEEGIEGLGDGGANGSLVFGDGNEEVFHGSDASSGAVFGVVVAEVAAAHGGCFATDSVGHDVTTGEMRGYPIVREWRRLIGKGAAWTAALSCVGCVGRRRVPKRLSLNGLRGDGNCEGSAFAPLEQTVLQGWAPGVIGFSPQNDRAGRSESTVGRPEGD